MPIDLKCQACGKVMRVADHYAGQRARCPGCKAVLTVPPPAPTAEASSEAYELDLPPARNDPPPRLRSYDADDVDQKQSEPVPSLHQPPRRFDEHGDERSWLTRPLLALGGFEITLLRIAAVLILLGAPLGWFLFGPARDAHVLAVEPVTVVEVLGQGATQQPYNLYTGTGNQAMGTQANPTGAATQVTYSVGGRDRLLVTRPDTQGDFVRVRLDLKQGTFSNLGMIAGYDTVLDGEHFRLRPVGAAVAAGEAAQLLSATFAQSVEVELGGALTSDYRALLPPVPPQRLDVQEAPGRVTGEAEYGLGPVQGTLTFSASRATSDAPASSGLFANGQLTLTDAAGATRVAADYQGSQLKVSWDPASAGHWGVSRAKEPTKANPFDRYALTLLFPRPANSADGGNFVLSLGGKDLATVALPRQRQPGGPAPSPIKSQQAGGPKPASKTATGPLAYFDVMRDARSQAKGIVAASNMQQLGYGMQLYLNDHNTFPDTLLDLRPYLGGNLEGLMRNPRTGEMPGFAYEKPEANADPGSTPVLWELYQGQRDMSGAMLYADGSIR